MIDSNLAQATIINKENNKHIQCMFNPKEYTFSKQTNWSSGKKSGSNIPKLTFSGGDPATLQMQLFFDTYDQQKDVRDHTDQIWELLVVDDALKDFTTTWGRPPRVRFQWGQTWLFDAVITNLTQKFTLFLPTGVPVRATLDVAFRQIEDKKELKAQNPTSGGKGGERLWTVREGDTLAWISFREYGDPGRWRLIADANALSNVRWLSPGERLVIPNA